MSNPTPYAWLNHGVLSDSTSVDLGFGSRLIKIADGAILSWRFGEDREFDYVLLVHLTDEEAQGIIESGTGMIEAVRRELRDADAMVVVAGDFDFAVQHTSILRDVSEVEFTNKLFASAERMRKRIDSFTFQRDWPARPVDEVSVVRQAIDFHNAAKYD